MTARTKERLTLWAPLVLGILTLFGGGVAWAMRTDNRVTALETHRAHDSQDIAKANDKLDFLIERLVR